MNYKNNLLYKLTEYGKDGLRPFHMPGHKRNRNFTPLDAYNIDITEIDDFDDLHHPENCLKDAMKRASRIFGTKETFFLVNGCTGGILAAISAVCKCGDKILLAKNSHKSAYNAMYINELKPVYLHCTSCNDPDYPAQYTLDYREYCIQPADVKAAFADNPDIKCVFITSPTYEGYVSDIKNIADITHEHGAILIVDEAHGAHMAFGNLFPKSAVSCDADIVIHGIHKTLPSLTQTALLHIVSDRIDVSEVKRYLSIFQTSSPSYILMGAIDYCMDFLETDGSDYYMNYCDNLHALYESNSIKNLKKLRVLPYDSDTRDASKIVIRINDDACTGMLTCNTLPGKSFGGRELYNLLREKYNLQPEMSTPEYVIMMTSIWDDVTDYELLKKALTEIDTFLCDSMNYYENRNNYDKGNNCNSNIITDFAKPGDIADDIIYIYPPGIPIISVGETYTDEIIDTINYFIKNGYTIKTNKGGTSACSM